ncbi:MAG TPA: 23S rRNA (uracil(1939)-C(5))-methyltransferase RlmD [Candidatus Dormibacteraeota bacterium]|nr:23S rRNA (uracil(1939)-C(5))-methyltransferase RlmD [Candidatus Dormibacteraeota bacterium]
MTNSEVARKSAAALAPGTELDLVFTDLLANGQAVARAEGLVVFCFGPLPGERARVRITSRKATYAVADLESLIHIVPERAKPFCPVFGTCGGCQVQHLSYDSQLRWKRDMVRAALQRIGGIADAAVDETVSAGNPRAYRNKVALVVERGASGPRVGFYRARSHDLVPVEGCPVVTPQLDDLIGIFARARSEAPAAVALEKARHVVARHAHRGEAVVSVTTAQPDEALETVAPALLAELPGVVGIVNSFDPRSANAVVGRNDRVLAGRAEIEEQIGGIRYRVSPASFFQINVEVVARIFDALHEHLGSADEVVDLYCGMGTFSLFFAKNGARVLGVEESRRAVGEAGANARLNDLEERVRFRIGLVEHWVRSPEGAKALASAGAVFLDPPRKGSDDVTLRAIAASRVKYIGYLSCDPATLARDLKQLVSNGYALRRIQPFDMFPQTGHVEVLVVLERQ